MTKTAIINLKTDPQLKKDSMELADALGVSLSLVLNESLKRFVATREFTATENYTPTDELKQIIKRSLKPSNKVAFKNQQSAIDFLDTL